MMMMMMMNLLPSIKAPHSNTGEVNIMGIFGLQMKMLKYVLQEKQGPRNDKTTYYEELSPVSQTLTFREHVSTNSTAKKFSNDFQSWEFKTKQLFHLQLLNVRWM